MRWIENRQAFLRNLHFLLTLGLALFPLLSLRATALLILLWGLVSVAGGIFISPSQWKKRWLPAVVISSIYLVSIAFLPFSSNPDLALWELEKSLSLLIFPLAWVFWPGRLLASQMEILYRIFILGCFLVSLIVFSQMVIFGFEVIGGDFSYSFRSEFERLSGVHPTYITMAFLMALFLKIKLMIRKWKKLNSTQKIFDLILFTFLFILSLLLAARTPLAAFFVALTISILFASKRRKIALLSLLVAGGFGILLAFQFPSLRTRISEMNPANFKPPKGMKYNSVNVRAGIFLCSAEILKENWLLGTGTGQVQNNLNECYGKFKTPVYKQKDYNAHNQFIHYWMGMGLPGLATFLLVLIYPLCMAIKNRKPVYIFFIIFFALCCLTENLLSRQMGVVFFGFFNALFLFNLLPPSNKKVLEDPENAL